MSKISRSSMMDGVFRLFLFIAAVMSIGYLRSRVAEHGFLCGVGDRILIMDIFWVPLVLWYWLVDSLRRRMAVFDFRYRMPIIVRCFELSDGRVIDYGRFILSSYPIDLPKRRNGFLRVIFILALIGIAAYVIFLPWTDVMALKACGVGYISLTVMSVVIGIVMLYDYVAR